MKLSHLKTIVVFFFLTCSLAQAKEFRLLLTSFDPFGGSSKNNTQEIVAELSQLANQLGNEVTVKTCNLPVIYDVGANVAMNCIDKEKPDAVISFGEASCTLQLETAFTNWDGTIGYPDNAGQVRNGSPIIENAPFRSGFEFPMHKMSCAIDYFSPPTRASNDTGAFVCNNVAYRLSQELKPKHIPFTFIHVPNSQCTSPEELKKNIKLLVNMIHTAITYLSKAGEQKTMPATKFEADQFLTDLKNQNAPACEIKFAEDVLDLYQ